MDNEQESKKGKPLTPEELQALPVGTTVYSRYGKEYTVDHWANHHAASADMGKMLVAVEDGGGLGTVAFTNIYGPGTLTPLSAPVELTTPEEIDALPVGTKVWAPTGREYTVEIWQFKPGDENSAKIRLLTAPGRVSGASSFIALHGWASLDPVSAAEASGLVTIIEAAVATAQTEHPDYRLRLDNEGWRVYCTGEGCEWSKLLSVPVGNRGQSHHRRHVAHEVATTAGLGAAQ